LLLLLLLQPPLLADGHCPLHEPPVTRFGIEVALLLLLLLQQQPLLASPSAHTLRITPAGN
jgi:hypothetical protein